MTRQRVADRGTECRVPLRCLLLDTDDFLETGRYSQVKAELRDNVEFCCDRWLVIIADKWDVELLIIDVCVLCLVMKILRIVALPCVHLFMFMRIEFGLLSFDWLAPSGAPPVPPWLQSRVLRILRAALRPGWKMVSGWVAWPGFAAVYDWNLFWQGC